MAQTETGCGRSTAAVSSSNVPDLRYASAATHHQGSYMVRGSAVPNGKDHDGKGYYYLQTGDALNLVTRVPTFAPHPAQQ
jgi:hypothetical protein